MNLAPPPSAMPPNWYPMLPPHPPPSSAFWNGANVQDRVGELQETLAQAKAMRRELQLLRTIKESEACGEDVKDGTRTGPVRVFLKHVEDGGVGLDLQEMRSLEAANSLISKLRAQLVPFKVVTDEASPWEEKSAVFRLSGKLSKSRRNKLWRKRKRRRVAEQQMKEREWFDQADQDADEWRAREIAKDIARRKIEKMKEIAKLKAKEERRRLESELELVLIVEKLQELRSMRVRKLKKQGHFLPEEDNEFLERVRVAVEEEESQARIAADADAARDAIATAEESRKTADTAEPDPKDQNDVTHQKLENKDDITDGEGNISSLTGGHMGFKKEATEGKAHIGSYDALANLPMEFYHYYHGSNTDMGTLIEVRRTWDAYLRRGGRNLILEHMADKFAASIYHAA
ncbi:U11/U12 small nuclear ribonucleoprotein 59 kDa protein isoform X2 [Rhodamnia argentea]|uniref:U11/U12 small nuclear ribonucleoprotein 59 kDa protein isoform X2 n=1 Tax=Rhodamnia argentea TaxID=178133 RepID=A0ABM3HTG2_9MYRT|nr:U11/U12 small nuclear ribonucleoprotein 59 kDa protein isoform X2 [Rhodamnia argentea]